MRITIAARRIRLPSLALLGLALLAGPACSQSGAVDTGSVPTTVETAYREALRLSPLPRDVEAEYRDWQASRSGDDDGAWHLERLQRRIVHDRRARALRVQPANLESGCLEIELKGCGVPAGGFLHTEDRTLYWQAQDGYTEEDGVGGGMVVLERGTADGPLTPVMWTAEGSRYDAPLLRDWGEDQVLLIVPGVSRGTGAGDMMRMMLWRDGAWRQVDTDWQSRAGAILNGLEVRHRPFWNFNEDLFAWTPLWNPSDAQCCAEAGTAILDFNIVEDRLTLVEARIKPAK